MWRNYSVKSRNPLCPHCLQRHGLLYRIKEPMSLLENTVFQKPFYRMPLPKSTCPQGVKKVEMTRKWLPLFLILEGGVVRKQMETACLFVTGKLILFQTRARPKWPRSQSVEFFENMSEYVLTICEICQDFFWIFYCQILPEYVRIIFDTVKYVRFIFQCRWHGPLPQGPGWKQKRAQTHNERLQL